MILVLSIFVIAENCIDNDNGKNYETISSVLESENSLSMDRCIDENTLQEQICENDQKGSELYLCPYGCFSGRCLDKNELGESFVLTQNEIQTIVFNGVSYEIDAPGCTGMHPPIEMKLTYQPGDGTIKTVIFENDFYEPKNLGNNVISIVQGCSGEIISLSLSFKRNLECTDSDNGKNYFKKGKIHLFGEWYVKEDDEREDYCFTSNEKLDSCSGDDCFVQEFFCGDYKTGKPIISSASYQCSGGCKNGACSGMESSQMSALTDKEAYYDYVGESMIHVSTKLSKFMDCEQYFVSPSGQEIFIGSGGCVEKGESFASSIPIAEYGKWKIKLILSDAEAPTKKYIIFTNEFDFLKKIIPTEKTGPVEITEIIENEKIVPEQFVVCSGCLLDNKCYPFGFRKPGNFCSDKESSFVEQKEGGLICDNNFECSSNVCISGECVSEGLLQKIINWFKNIFD
tara:strand:- start:572 stop:1942 length:1371 start_codon:yes stop_codon:yes gene_type:complete